MTIIERDRHFRLATMLAHILDDQFSFFGFRFGIDPIIGILPISGDLVSFLVGLYILWVGFIHQLPGERLAQMFKNLTIDLVVGALPVIGDVGDVVFKANMKNLEMIKQHRQGTIEGSYG